MSATPLAAEHHLDVAAVLVYADSIDDAVDAGMEVSQEGGPQMDPHRQVVHEVHHDDHHIGRPADDVGQQDIEKGTRPLQTPLQCAQHNLLLSLICQAQTHHSLN